ncbi:putative Methyltransf_11 domain-containing protein [Azospirillaceae bacterium]
MLNSFKMKSAANRYLLLQRTQFQRPISQVMQRLCGVNFYSRWMMGLVEYGRGKKIADLYYKAMQEEFDILRPHLPKTCNHFIDVGCGLAGIDALIYSHYQNAGPNVTLVDKTGTSKIYYGYKTEASYYNDLGLSVDFLISNGIEPSKITAINIDQAPFPTKQADFVLSLMSWGYHYPVETYLNAAFDVLTPGGLLFLDLRENDQLSQVQKTIRDVFGDIKIIAQTNKIIKIMAQKL